MPIKSYIAHPYEGRKEELEKELLAIEALEVISSLTGEILVIVSDTADEVGEVELEQTLQEISSLKHLSLVCGFEEEVI